MGQWSQFVTALVDVSGEAAKVFVLDQLHQRILRPRPNIAGSRDAMGEAPPVDGCPYCGVAKRMATAHRYLVRGRSNPELLNLYRHLAFLQVQEAATILNLAMSNTPDEPTLDLSRRVIDLNVALSKPLSGAELEVAISRAWDTGEIALDLAEGVNAKAPGGTTGKPCIEGEARFGR